MKGQATLDGALSITVAPGYYANGFSVTSDQWIQAKTIANAFSTTSATIASPTLKARVSSRGNNTYTAAVSRDQNAYAQYASDANSRHAGQALYSSTTNSLPSSSRTLITALDFSNPNGATIRDALPQLTGEAYASTTGALVNVSATNQSAISGRLGQAFGSTSTTPIVVASAANVPVTMNHNPDLAAWGYGFGTWADQKSGGGAAKLKTTTGGFLIGMDSLVGDHWRAGAMAGYSNSIFKVRDRASSGSSDNYTLGAYAGREWPSDSGSLALRSGLSYTWHRLDMDRSVGFAGYQDKLSADYNAGTFQLFGELGYQTHLSERATFEPYASLAYVNVDTDRFTEKGNNGAALTVRSDTMNTVFSTLGIRASTQFDLGHITSSARVDIGWRHAFADSTPTSTASFTSSNPFSVSGTSIGKNVAILETGLDFNVTRHTTLGLVYQGQFGSGLTQNAFNVNLNARF